MEWINRKIEKTNGSGPTKILQFGEGNFARAFADWMIDRANSAGVYDGRIVVCQPASVSTEKRDLLNSQDCMYTVLMRAEEEGRSAEKADVVTSISRCLNAMADPDELIALAKSPDLAVILSNTTEAGITYRSGEKMEDFPGVTFPAKLTRLLYERYRAFDGDKSAGLLFLPMELIDRNGDALREIMRQIGRDWELGDEFEEWLLGANHFANTMVDRIVTGFPTEESDEIMEKLGYRDRFIVTCESYCQWIIEGDLAWAENFPIHKANKAVIWTDNLKEYKTRKVRILNGAHTSTVPSGILMGYETVRDLMQDKEVANFMKNLLSEEVIPTLRGERTELEAYAASVLERFNNPYIHHRLSDISMNSVSKYAVRCLPSIDAYYKRFGEIPERLAFSLACLLRFYRPRQEGGKFVGSNENGETYVIRDAESVCVKMAEHWTASKAQEAVRSILNDKDLWGEDTPGKIPGLSEAVGNLVEAMERTPIRELMLKLQ